MDGQKRTLVETLTLPNAPKPIGPYSHIAKVGNFITISATAGVDPATGQLVGNDVYSQSKRILETFAVMLDSVNSDLSHVVHVNVFLKDMDGIWHDEPSLHRKDGQSSSGAHGHWRSRITDAGRFTDDEPYRRY